jgi:uncharacterized protein YndB with AHSA1/START domain
MVNLDLSVLIDRPVKQVFEFATTPTNMPKWQSTMVDIKANTPGPVKVGSTYTTIGEMLGRKLEGLMEVTAYEPDTKFGFKAAAGPMQINATITFKPAGTGTKVSLNAQGNPGGLFKLAEGVVAGQIKNVMEGNLARLKSYLESGA